MHGEESQTAFRVYNRYGSFNHKIFDYTKEDLKLRNSRRDTTTKVCYNYGNMDIPKENV